MQDSQGGWLPILVGAEQELALEAIHAIAGSLRDLDNPWVKRTDLASGQAGVALLYAYLALAEGSDTDADTAMAYIEQALATATRDPEDPALYSGLAGVGWVVAHLKDGLLDAEDVEEICEVVDRLVLAVLDASPWQADYDLISGLAGFGVYLLERLPGQAAVHGLERIVEHLATLAERTDAGLTWFTPRERLPEWQRKLAPDGYYNLGLAHGVPGVIGLLSELHRLDIAPTEVPSLLEGAVSWLLGQKQEQRTSCFLDWIGPRVTDRDSRVAWCYGDLGRATSLLLAGRLTNSRAWEADAIAIAKHASQRRSEDAGVVDAGLCHGAAGNGHLFNRMFQATRNKQLEDAAKFWLKRTLEMRRSDEGLAGYLMWSAAGDEKLGWVPEAGLLNGVAGVALALLAAVRPLVPSWDRVLLAAIPARSPSDPV